MIEKQAEKLLRPTGGYLVPVKRTRCNSLRMHCTMPARSRFPASARADSRRRGAHRIRRPARRHSPSCSALSQSRRCRCRNSSGPRLPSCQGKLQNVQRGLIGHNQIPGHVLRLDRQLIFPTLHVEQRRKMKRAPRGPAGSNACYCIETRTHPSRLKQGRRPIALARPSRPAPA